MYLPFHFLPFALSLQAHSSPSAISHALLMRQMSHSQKELYQNYFLTLTHALLLSFTHLFLCSQSWEHAFCIMRRANRISARKKKNRAWLWHAKNLCGIVFIMEQSTENARARNMIQQYQLKSKFRSLNSTMSHKVIKYLKYILWLTGCWQSLKHIALPFDRAVDGNAIKLLSDFIQHHWKWNMRRQNILYNNQP